VSNLLSFGLFSDREKIVVAVAVAVFRFPFPSIPLFLLIYLSPRWVRTVRSLLTHLRKCITRCRRVSKDKIMFLFWVHVFIKCNQHYQIYKPKSHQRRTTIHELTLSLHLLARSLALLRLSSSSPYMRVSLLPRLLAYLYKICLAGVAPQYV